MTFFAKPHPPQNGDDATNDPAETNFQWKSIRVLGLESHDGRKNGYWIDLFSQKYLWDFIPQKSQQKTKWFQTDLLQQKQEYIKKLRISSQKNCIFRYEKNLEKNRSIWEHVPETGRRKIQMFYSSPR